MSDYISKSALIEQLSEVDDEIVKGCIGVIQTQPTISETEIIRKAFERVVERLEEKMPISWKFDYIGGKKDGIVEAIKIVKEECGISE